MTDAHGDAPQHSVGLLDGQAAGLTVVVAAGAIVALHQAETLCVPVLVSVLLAYALEPFFKALMRTGLPRAVAAILVYAAIASIAVNGVHVVRAKVDRFLDDLLNAIAIATRQLPQSSAPGPLRQLQTAADDLRKTIDNAAPAVESSSPKMIDVGRRFDIRAYLLRAGMTATGAGLRATIVIVLTFVLLATGDLYKRKIVDLAGSRRADRQLTIDVIQIIDRQIERFLLVRILISVIVGTATGVGVRWAGLDHAFVWGVVAGVLNVLPLIGPTVGVALITLAAFLQFHAIRPCAVVGGIALVVAALEGNLITPWLTGRAGELNMVAVFVSVLFWGWMWDLWGLLLAVPIMVAVKAAADHIEPLQPIGEFLGR